MMRRVTPRNGGSTSEIGPLDRNAIEDSLFFEVLFYRRVGNGGTGSDRAPAVLTARTPNNTSSLLTSSFRCVSAPALWLCVHCASSVSRHTTSYVVPGGANADASHVSSLLLSNAFVRMCTFCGSIGAAAN